MPGAFGGNSRNVLGPESKVSSALEAKGVPANVTSQISSGTPKFWGDPNSSGGGPFYSGTLIVLLALLGFDHLRFTYPVSGVNMRLTNVTKPGSEVVRAVMA